MIVLTSHGSYVNGKIYEPPVNTLVEVLISAKSDFLHIRHSIDGSIKSKVYFYSRGQVRKTTTLDVPQKPTLSRYWGEYKATVKLFKRLKKRHYIYIGADPANAFIGLQLKKKHLIDKLIFYSVDFSDKRFANPILNATYLAIDKHCARHCDQVWNVSSRILSRRTTQGIPENKNIYVPNAPASPVISRPNHQPGTKLITLGIISDQLDFKNLFEAIKILLPTFTSIKLTVVGSGPKETEYKSLAQKLNLGDAVEFTGYLPHHLALKKIQDSDIGLALYNGNWSFNYYGDSMKCREYFTFGLPVITTDTHSTVEDIVKYKAGIVCPMSPAAYAKAIKTILNHYPEYSQSAIDLATKYNGIHSRLLKELESL